MEITNEGTEVLAQLGEYFNVYSDDHKLPELSKINFILKMYMSFQEIPILIEL